MDGVASGFLWVASHPARSEKSRRQKQSNLIKSVKMSIDASDRDDRRIVHNTPDTWKALMPSSPTPVWPCMSPCMYDRLWLMLEAGFVGSGEWWADSTQIELSTCGLA